MSEVKRWEPRDTIVGFDMQPLKDGSFVLSCDYDAAQSELAALREELARTHATFVNATKVETEKWAKRLADAERRNAELAGYRWRNPLNSIYAERKEWCLVSIKYGEVLLERKAQAIKSNRYAEDEFNSAYEIEPVYAALKTIESGVSDAPAKPKCHWSCTGCDICGSAGHGNSWS